MRLITSLIIGLPFLYRANSEQFTRQEWDRIAYFSRLNPRAGVERYNSKGEMEKFEITTYTQDLMSYYNLTGYLTQPNTLQFGPLNGEFLSEQLSLGKKVLAYEYSKEAVSNLKEKGINAKLIDLNDRNNDDTELNYAEQLTKDLALPTNILAVRIFQYLEPAALRLLLIHLVLDAAPGSIYVIMGTVNNEKTNEPTTRTFNYKLSFFAPRTDMKLLMVEKINKNDELLIIEKTSSSLSMSSREL